MNSGQKIIHGNPSVVTFSIETLRLWLEWKQTSSFPSNTANRPRIHQSLQEHGQKVGCFFLKLLKLIPSKDVEMKCSILTNIRASEGNTKLTCSKYSSLAFQVHYSEIGDDTKQAVSPSICTCVQAVKKQVTWLYILCWFQTSPLGLCWPDCIPNIMHILNFYCCNNSYNVRYSCEYLQDWILTLSCYSQRN